MQLTELLAYLDARRALTSLDINALQEAAGRIERAVALVEGWAAIGQEEPYFNLLQARHGRFDFIPLEWGGVVSDTTQAIANDTLTAIQWDEAVGQPLAFTWDSAAPSRLHVVGLEEQHAYLFIGRVRFDASASGLREVVLRCRDSLWQDTLLRVPPAGAEDTVLSFAAVRILEGIEDYLELLVRQTSGSLLNLEEAQLHWVRVY